MSDSHHPRILLSLSLVSLGIHVFHVLMGNIRYQYIYIFVGWDIIESIMWYLFG